MVAFDGRDCLDERSGVARLLEDAYDPERAERRHVGRGGLQAVSDGTHGVAEVREKDRAQLPERRLVLDQQDPLAPAAKGLLFAARPVTAGAPCAASAKLPRESVEVVDRLRRGFRWAMKRTGRRLMRPG